MLTLDESRILIEFLDRVPLTGHQERVNMNVVIDKIVTMSNSNAPADKKPKGDKANAVS